MGRKNIYGANVMATRKAKKTTSKATKSTAYGKAGSLVSKAVSGAKSIITGKKSSTGKRRAKKSLVWYVKETARLKAKRKYLKEKIKVM